MLSNQPRFSIWADNWIVLRFVSLTQNIVIDKLEKNVLNSFKDAGFSFFLYLTGTMERVGTKSI